MLAHFLVKLSLYNVTWPSVKDGTVELLMQPFLLATSQEHISSTLGTRISFA